MCVWVCNFSFIFNCISPFGLNSVAGDSVINQANWPCTQVLQLKAVSCGYSSGLCPCRDEQALAERVFKTEPQRKRPRGCKATGCINMAGQEKDT